MDIDTSISSGRKKYKITVGAVRIDPPREKEEDNMQLEHCSKRKTNPINPVAAVIQVSSSLVAGLAFATQASSPITVDKDTPHLVLRGSPSVPVVEETPTEISGGLFLWHDNLSA